MNCGTWTDPYFTDAADIVAPEIDEHDVLGSPLLVALQFLPESQVLFVGAASRAGARDRVCFPRGGPSTRTSISGDEPTIDTTAPPRRIHTGGRVHVAKRAAHGERIGRDRRLEALREDDLVDIAGRDVLLRRSNLRFEFLA